MEISLGLGTGLGGELRFCERAEDVLWVRALPHQRLRQHVRLRPGRRAVVGKFAIGGGGFGRRRRRRLARRPGRSRLRCGADSVELCGRGGTCGGIRRRSCELLLLLRHGGGRGVQLRLASLEVLTRLLDGRLRLCHTRSSHGERLLAQRQRLPGGPEVSPLARGVGEQLRRRRLPRGDPLLRLHERSLSLPERRSAVGTALL
mmetsp:Transcript_7656/g.24599  ORF Transcript_7656/g.24599 Transcript_7656/m.24599 type:complete len:203 (-) Transcript_7656:257-865(-)